MKKCTALLLTAILLSSIFLLAGCGKNVDSPLIGDWAYIHDTQTTVISLKSDGNAIYNGDKYTYTTDDNFINLSSKDKTLKLRYEKTKDGFLMYQTTEYTYVSGGAPSSIVGLWSNASTKWSYEFTEDGTFNEDGYFPGHYSVDENEGTVKLMYNDHFEDTTIYYKISGTTLTIDYPWAMVAAQ